MHKLTAIEAQEFIDEAGNLKKENNPLGVIKHYGIESFIIDSCMMAGIERPANDFLKKWADLVRSTMEKDLHLPVIAPEYKRRSTELPSAYNLRTVGVLAAPKGPTRSNWFDENTRVDDVWNNSQRTMNAYCYGELNYSTARYKHAQEKFIQFFGGRRPMKSGFRPGELVFFGRPYFLLDRRHLDLCPR